MYSDNVNLIISSIAKCPPPPKKKTLSVSMTHSKMLPTPRAR